MEKYRVVLERIQRGVKLDWTKTVEIETSRPPKIGEGKTLLVDPPIIERIASFEKI